MKRLRGLVLGAILCCLAVEIGARLVLPRLQRGRGIQFDKHLGWRPCANVVRVGKDWGVNEPARTNSLGWRDGEFHFGPQPDVYRVAALGDSFTWGAGVDYGERWTEHLERLVPGLEALNFGVNAYGSDQVLRTFELHALPQRPKAAIVTVFLGNDFEDIRYARRFDWPKPYFVLEAGELRLVPPIRTWDVSLRTSSYLGEALFRLLPLGLERNLLAPEHISDDTALLLAALLERLVRNAEASGVAALIVPVFPCGYPAAAPLPRERRFLDALAAASLPVLDLRPAFTADAGQLYLADGHWNDAGHALVAGEIARWIADTRQRSK